MELNEKGDRGHITNRAVHKHHTPANLTQITVPATTASTTHHQPYSDHRTCYHSKHHTPPTLLRSSYQPPQQAPRTDQLILHFLNNYLG